MIKRIILFIVFGFAVVQTQAQQPKHQFLLFWRSDCGHCEVVIRQLVARCAKLNQESFRLTTISFDTDSLRYFNAIKSNKMEGFENKYDFGQCYVNHPLTKQYGITKSPTFLYVDAQGNVQAQGREAFVKLSSLR